MESIFVQIATYHDYELPNTINDILEKSSGNNHINIGVYLCYHKSQDIEIPNLSNVKVKTGMAPEGIGLGYSRLQAHNFYDGETYYLQIDSHSKMNKNWDEQIISYIKEYKDMGFEKPLITNYPRNYWYDDNGVLGMDSGERITQISFHEKPEQFKALRIPTQTAMDNKEDNIFSRSISGGSVFTVGGFLVPNPRIAFYGEEIFIAARAYTNGYDLLLPKSQYMYHLYFDHSRIEASKRRLIWQDWSEEFAELDRVSKEEIYKTLTEGTVGPEHLGTERTLEDYGRLIGLNFNTGEVYENC